VRKGSLLVVQRLADLKVTFTSPSEAQL